MPNNNSVNRTSDQFVVKDHLTVGQDTAVPSIPFAGGALPVAVLIDTEGLNDLGGVVENRHTNAANFGANLILSRTRGTHASPTAVQSGDNVARLLGLGFDGTDFTMCTEVRSEVTGTVAAGKTPGQLVISTADDATGAMQTALTISNAQVVNLSNALPVGSGGTGVTGTPTNGQLLIGNGSGYTQATLTAGSNVIITNGAGSISIAASGGGSGLTYNSVSADTNMVADNGYFLTGSTNRTLTLPATAAVGSILQVVNVETGLFTIAQNAGQDIRFGALQTTPGVTGDIVSSTAGDALTLACYVADTSWVVIASNGPTFTVN